MLPYVTDVRLLLNLFPSLISINLTWLLWHVIAQGDCKWAQWLLFSRVKGYEYEASFSNARWNLSQKMVNHGNLTAIEIDEILYTVDDMAERIGEMSALATLMYASLPIQKSICTGSVNRNRGLSSQCTLENLGPCLQQFPTLWKTLRSTCFGEDGYGCQNYSPTNGNQDTISFPC
jgi:spatacsin